MSADVTVLLNQLAEFVEPMVFTIEIHALWFVQEFLKEETVEEVAIVEEFMNLFAELMVEIIHLLVYLNAMELPLLTILGVWLDSN